MRWGGRGGIGGWGGRGLGGGREKISTESTGHKIERLLWFKSHFGQ